MLSQTIPLPPLKASNQRQLESYLPGNIRSEMNKIQQSLQRSNQLFNDYLSDIPLDISESLQEIQESQNSISKEIRKNKLDNIKEKLSKYNSTVDSLSSDFYNHIELAQTNGQIDFFAEIFPSFKESLITQNQTILDNLEKQLLEKVNDYEQKIKIHDDTSQYKLKSPFSDLESKKHKKEKKESEIESFSTLDTVLNLEKHNKRLQSLENKIEIALNRQKESQIALKKDKTKQTTDSVMQNHEKIKKLLIQSRVISKKIEHPIPRISDDQPEITFKKKSNVEQYEFENFSRNINELNDKIITQIESFESFAEQKISGFNQNVEAVEQKVVDFENMISQLNELVGDINQKIEHAEDNYDELENNKNSFQINHSDISDIINSFKTKLSTIQSEARNEIEQLKLQLNTLESKYSL